ncbi:nucleotidyltransferase domain-containing protein [Aquimarina sp. ERC-38]|uniref:nucleotidyltransferase domain-containing protein n=1 Tax=Aquimarina sp. ERC-38 TaxID=2949996 RepID=UPI0022467DCC|nr:nucleotidyltransferase domain-containing protein [Aquimarina sp. ERC-38]UZO80156.1 nucleotidyltransferase domain-containing protein [Aquimarina sp. ERC-38]
MELQQHTTEKLNLTQFDIKTRLGIIKKSRKVNILYACESGSRAWGFASPDSDYDVRFLYTHPLEWYVKLAEQRDTIDFIDEDFDAVGWELRKSLRLLKKSNVPALEHLFSPIPYQENNEWIVELRDMAKDCFSPIAGMYHYLSMSKKYEAKLTGSTIKLKSLFYALRTTIAGKWILEYKTLPPVVFSKMLYLVSPNIEKEIKDLMMVKSENKESYVHSRNEKLFRFVSETIASNDKYAKSLPSGKPNMERMDHFLFKSVTEK